MNKIIKKTDSFVIEHDIETDSILHTVNGFLVTDEWKDLLTTGKNYFKEKGLSRWISDNRNLPIVHNNIDEWLKNEWLSSMITLGWKHWAIIEPSFSEGRINHKKYETTFSQEGVSIGKFENLNQAKNWLKEV